MMLQPATRSSRPIPKSCDLALRPVASRTRFYRPLISIQMRFDERLRRLRQRLGRALPATQGLAARIGAFDQKEKRVRELRGPGRADGISQPDEPPQHLPFVGVHESMPRMVCVRKFRSVIDEWA